MMYEYMEFADQTLVTHSRVLGEGNSETARALNIALLALTTLVF